jgi:hypothetical protein
MVFGVLVVQILLILFGVTALQQSTLIGFIYPAYKTIDAIDSGSIK